MCIVATHFKFQKIERNLKNILKSIKFGTKLRNFVEIFQIALKSGRSQRT